MGEHGKWAQIEQGQYYFIGEATAWAPQLTSAAASPPAASDALCGPEHAAGGGEGRGVLLFSFTVFFFSAEFVSLLESSESSVAGDLCLNFCSQRTGFLLLEAELLLFPFPFSEWFFIPSAGLWWPSASPLVTRTFAPEIWKMSFLWKPKNKLSVTEAW